MFYHEPSQQEFSSLQEFRLAFPHTSFGQLDSEAERNATGLFTVTETTPVVNELYAYSEKDGVEINGDVYVRKWRTVPYPPSKVRLNLLRTVTQKRKQIETGGLTLPNGIRVSTDIDDQNRITSVIANAEMSGVTQLDFKAETGWISLSILDIKNIAIAIALHVQACFTAERNHHANIDALTNEELVTYDINSGWPSN